MLHVRKKEFSRAKIKVIKKPDEYSTDYQERDILEVTGTWYGGFNVKNKTGIPLFRDKEACEEFSDASDLSHEEYLNAANCWKEHGKFWSPNYKCFRPAPL